MRGGSIRVALSGTIYVLLSFGCFVLCCVLLVHMCSFVLPITHACLLFGLLTYAAIMVDVLCVCLDGVALFYFHMLNLFA